MGIEFNCLHCGVHLEAEDEMGGKAVQCPHCDKTCSVPDPTRHPVSEKPHLKISAEEAVRAHIADAKKHCPKCQAEVPLGVIVCESCGYSFVKGVSVYTGKRPSRFGIALGSGLRLILRLVLLAVLAALGFVGFVGIQDFRLSQQVKTGLETGELDAVADSYRKLASWYAWFERVHLPNRYDLRYRQFVARRGLAYAQTKDAQFPMIVEKSVWGNKGHVDMRAAWVRFRLANLSEEPLPVHQKYFLLLGLDTNVALATTSVGSDPGSVTLRYREGVQGALHFTGIVKPPAFLEYNNGVHVVRAPIEINFAMDNYPRDARDWPAPGKALDEFPLAKPWAEQKFGAEETMKLWKSYTEMKPPPAEPFTTVFKETNPR